MTDTSPPPTHIKIDYVAVQASPEFTELRAKRRGFVLPLTAIALLWFFGYVILGTYFSDFMATPVFGYVNIGLLLGLAQFVTTFAITMGYVRYANRRLDPLATELRAELEARAGGAA
jgi:uncharacterized membrane protein (DUF485 family)